MEAYLDEFQKIGNLVMPSASFKASLNPMRAFSAKAPRAKGVKGPMPMAVKSPAPKVPGIGRQRVLTNLTGGQNLRVPSVAKRG